MGAFLHDHAGAQEADARHDIADHAHRAIARAHAQAQVDKGGRADADQHNGAQSGGALPPLALEADQPAQDKGGQKCRRGVAEQVEVLIQAQGVTAARSCRRWWRSPMRTWSKKPHIAK